MFQTTNHNCQVSMALRTLAFLSAIGLSSAFCPFKRDANPDISPDQVAEILARINANLPEVHEEKEKRQTGFDPAAQHIDVTGDHAWQAPGPHDM